MSQNLNDIMKASVQAHQAGRLEEAERGYRSVLASAPNTGAALNMLGALLARQRKYDEALRYLRRAAKVTPSTPSVWQNLATTLRSARKMDEAIEAFAQLGRLEPNNPWALAEIGWCYESVHKLDEACEAAERALSLDAGHPFAGLLMAHLDQRSGAHEAARDRLRGLIPALNEPRLLAKAHYLMAACADRLGDYDGAWGACESAAAALMASPGFQSLDIRLYPTLCDRYGEFYASDEGLGTLGHDAPHDKHPRLMFVVGFPRSGTTMVENILAAHPEIRSSDEEPYFHEQVMMGVARVLGNRGNGVPFPESIGRLTDTDVKKLRDAYFKSVKRAIGSLPAGTLFVDKVPFNIIHAGLIGRVFPDAKMLVVIRDPRDAVVSNVMQDYGLTQFTVDLITAERTANLYAKGMSLWLGVREKLPQQWK
ncbi:MAG: sulfotransferase, partial [Phycisphaerales bacterium]|nr:sulfotransferase [Phycisphaerales bacterium]